MFRTPSMMHKKLFFLAFIFWFTFIFFELGAVFAATDSHTIKDSGKNSNLIVKPDFKKARRFFDAGVKNLKGKNYDEATFSFKSVIQLLKGNELSSKAFNNLGIAYYFLKNYDDALEAYQGAIFLDPKCATANFNLGNLLFNLKNYEESIETYKQFLKVSPGHRKTAQAYLEMGKAADLMEDGRSSIIFTREAKQNFLESGDIKNVAKSKDILIEFYEKYEYKPEDFAFIPQSPIEKIYTPILSFFQLLISFVVFI